MRRVIYISLLLFGSFSLGAQSPTGDDCIASAMELAKENKLEATEKKLAKCVSQFPERLDIRIAHARSLAWQGKYKQALSKLEDVYTIDEKNTDALLLDADIALWSKSAKKSIRKVNDGLAINPKHEGFLFRKARLSRELLRNRTAWENLEALLNVNPDHEEGNRLKKSMKVKSKPTTLGVTFISENFSEIFDSRFTTNIYAKVPRRNVIFLGDINLTEINSRQGLQAEISAYPSLGKFGYAYLNFGWSKSLIFPRYKMGAEIFKDFKRISFSLGLRRNVLHNNRSTNIYVASISRSVKKLVWTYRIFGVPLDNKWSLSHVFDWRVTSERKNMFHGFVGLGNYTELNPNQFQDELSFLDPRLFQRFGFDYNRHIDFATVKVGFIFTRQEFHQFPHPFIRKMTYILGFEVRF